MVFHIVVIKIRRELAEIEFAKKILSKFSLVGIFPYWVLCKQLQLLLWEAQNEWKSSFSKVDLLGWGCWEVDMTLEIDWFDPKWHPKSLVLISYTCWGSISRWGEMPAIRGPPLRWEWLLNLKIIIKKSLIDEKNF